MITALACLLAAQDVGALVDRAVKGAGGKENLPALFRIKERIAVTADLEAKGGERVSVLEPPGHWWVNKKDRVAGEKEPAVYLTWAWTLGALLDPKSKLEALPGTSIGGNDVLGIRIGGSIDPPMDLWLDAKDARLAAIDWRKDRHVFSDWKEAGGFHYASRVIGYKPDGKVWYHTRVLEFERLKELPADLKR